MKTTIITITLLAGIALSVFAQQYDPASDFRVSQQYDPESDFEVFTLDNGKSIAPSSSSPLRLRVSAR